MTPVSARERCASLAGAVAALMVLAGCTPAVPGHVSEDSSPTAAAATAATAGPAVSSRSPDDVSLEGAGLPTLEPEAVRERVPTRVVVRELGIDLPIVAPAGISSGRFPWCNVAEFLPTMSRPGRPGPTFVYAHAREGMFLPILVASRVHDGRAMVGIRVQVFTSDDRRFTYEVSQVVRHAVSLDFAYRETAEQLILQTSEGPSGTPGKTMLVALPIAEAPASPADARPEASPVRCR